MTNTYFELFLLFVKTKRLGAGHASIFG